MSQEFDCHYGEAEFNTIKAGIEAIESKSIRQGNAQGSTGRSKAPECRKKAR